MNQSFILFFLLSLGSLVIEAQDFFPLVPGSTWVYRSSNGLNRLTIKVGPAAIFDGEQYLRVEGYAPKPYYIRQTNQGNFVFRDEQKNADVPFLTFRGSDFASVATGCAQTGRAENRSQSYTGPIGTSNEARVIRYTPGVCADAGLTSESFVPYLGMVQRTETSFIGEKKLDLIYAQIGGITYVTDGGVSFGLSLTSVPDGISARLTLHNRTSTPVDLTFPSGQTYDFSVKNSAGTVVYTWSANKLFIQEIRQLNLKGEEVWFELLPMTNLPAGVYSVEAKLVNSDGRKFSTTSTISWP